MKNSKEKNQQPSPRANTRLEVAEEYSISRRTLRRRLKVLNIQISPWQTRTGRFKTHLSGAG